MLSLIGLNLNVLLGFFRAIFCIGRIAERGIVCSHSGQLAVARSEELFRAQVRLRELTVDGIGQCIARIVHEAGWHLVFSFTAGLGCSDVAPSRLSHGSNQVRTLGIGKFVIVSRSKVSRWLIRHLQLPAFLIQVELPHLVVTEPFVEILRVAGLQVALILVLDKFILMLNAVLA